LKKYFILVFVFHISALVLQAQSVGLGYSTNNSVQLDCTWGRGKTVYQLGIASQRSDAVGKKVDERKPNYGLDQTGRGDSYASLDIGIGFRTSSSSKVIFIGTVGQREFYTNYSDHRFNGGGYHMIDNTKFVGGAGVAFHLGFNTKMGVELGYNSIHGGVVTLQYLF
jgi:hypothetical protein